MWTLNDNSRHRDLQQSPGVDRDALDGVSTLLDTIFETADDAIFLMEELRFVDCNPAALRMFGCNSKDDVVGQTPMSFSPPVQPDGSDSAETARRYMTAALAGAPQDFEWRHWRLDRTEFDVEVKLHRCFVGGAPFLIAVVRDISMRKRLATQLLESKLFSDSLIDSLPGFFYVFDSNLRLVRWNKIRAAELGYINEDDLKQMGLESFLGPQANRPEVMALAREILRGTAPTTFLETQIARKDGTLVSYLCSGVRVNSPSGPMLLGVGFDITEQKRAAMERDQLLAELQALSRERERFLVGLSHELQNSLEAIQMSARLLRQDRHLEQAALRSIQPACVPLSDVLFAAVDSCRLEADEVGVSLVTEIEPGSWVSADSARMERVFVNLVENGLKFTPSGGRVRVSTSVTDRTAVIIVEDTGVGIDPRLLPRIAETFHQAEIGKTSPGLGIGLALVNSIVRLHGGRVRAESSGLGRGSRFIVELPLCEAPEAQSGSTVSV
jgi:two-component system CheB/CheR fusion protein